MAVSKIWAVKSRLDKVLDYAANPDKTGFTEDELTMQKTLIKQTAKNL